MAIPPKADDQRLRSAVQPILERHGLICEDLRTQRVGASTRVVITVDLPEDEIGSVDLDTVADASEEISQLLDDDPELIGEGPSTLEVTTPGVFRPLTQLRHFKRSRTRLLSGAAADGREFYGRLTEVEGDTLVIDVMKPQHKPKKKGSSAPSAERYTPGIHRIPLADLSSAQIELDFRA